MSCLFFCGMFGASLALVTAPAVADDARARWLAERKGWVKQHCSSHSDDPQCRKWLKRKTALRETPKLDCDKALYDERCSELDRKRDQRWKDSVRTELSSFCSQNRNAPRCRRNKRFTNKSYGKHSGKRMNTRRANRSYRSRSGSGSYRAPATSRRNSSRFTRTK